MVNPQIKSRLNPKELKEFNELKAILGYTELYGSDSKTIKAAIRLAIKHLKLKARIKELFSGNLDF